MAREKLPYFKWFPKDFDNDEAVRLMNIEEIGLYAVCLNHSWINGSIPADLGELSRAMKLPRKQLERAWPRVAPCFVEGKPGRLVNPRQEDERRKALRKSEKCSDAVGVRYGRSKDLIPRAYGSGSDSGSVEKKEDGVFSQITPRSIAETLWDIHPSPAKLGFVESAVFNELQKTIMTPERFRDAIVQSLREWAEYWSESNRMATGLDNWVASGDYAVKPPPVQEKRNRKSVMDGV